MPAGESARAMATHLRQQAEQLRLDAGRWESGAIGEERVEAALTAENAHTMRVLHDRLLKPGESAANLDHLVVCVGGVYLVDAKNWIGSINVHNNSLWKHWNTADGRRSENQNQELYKIRSMAQAATKTCGHRITPVLCLAGDNSAAFGDAQEVKGVTVLPVGSLLSWLRTQQVTSTPEHVASLAVQLSMTFPPAANPGLTLASLTPAVPPAPAAVLRRHSAPRSRSRSRPRPRASVSPRRTTWAKPIAAVVALLAFLAIAPKVTGALVHRLEASAADTRPVSTAPASATPVATTLTALERQRLDDWRIKAGLYEANAQPSALPYVPDAGLGTWSNQCRQQWGKLTPYRTGLVKAPDPQLAAASAQFDQAARNLLHACMHNQPVQLHHARAAMTTAAALANARYNVLLGQDPKAVNAQRVL